jgi:hypothetical protein
MWMQDVVARHGDVLAVVAGRLDEGADGIEVGWVGVVITI